MVGINRNDFAAPPTGQNVEDAERRLEALQDVEEFGTVAASTATADILAILRPPELQIENQSRLGGPRFEAQAIASLDVLKVHSEEEMLNNLAGMIIDLAPEMEATKNPDIKAGMDVLDGFLQNSAMLLAMKTGRMG